MMVMRISLAKDIVFGETSIKCRTFKVFQAISCLILSKPRSISCTAWTGKFRGVNKLAKKDRSVKKRRPLSNRSARIVLVVF